MCLQGSGPHSAAKQGRSFRVAALKLPGSLCAQGGPSHILQQTGPFFSSLRVAVPDLALLSGNLENCGCFWLTKFCS